MFNLFANSRVVDNAFKVGAKRESLRRACVVVGYIGLMDNPRPAAITKTEVTAFNESGRKTRTDRLATEEPLEIRLESGNRSHRIAVTMRTPGHDFELAAGFLFTEGIVTDPALVREIKYCVSGESEQLFNVVTIDYAGQFDPAAVLRNFYTTSSCGICGKASLEALEMKGATAVAAGPVVTPAVVGDLPDMLRRSQKVFESTGGLHAAGLFDAAGKLMLSREDVGRHNAVDKLIGRCFIDRKVPPTDSILMVSGRASFEIMQKTVAAGVPVLCAVSAPSSLAVDVARRFGVTLIGFVRDGRFNVYAGEERLSRT